MGHESGRVQGPWKALSQFWKIYFRYPNISVCLTYIRKFLWFSSKIVKGKKIILSDIEEIYKTRGSF